MKAIINVFLKKNILDPQGVTVHKALTSMGYDSIKSLRMGKRFEIEVDASSEEEAKKMLSEASEKLLSNPVIEDYEVEIV